MIQLDYNRAEEYITLRDEMLKLKSFSWQTLYWTMLLTLGCFVWYLAKPVSERIPIGFLGLLLISLFIISFLVYMTCLREINRICSYIAVFWESSNLERGLKWHRFTRRGSGESYSYIGMFVYSSAIMMVGVCMFILPILAGQPPEVLSYKILRFIVMGIGVMSAFFTRILYVRALQESYESEREWRLIRFSQERQDKIHGYYDKTPDDCDTIAIENKSRQVRASKFDFVVFLLLALSFSGIAWLTVDWLDPSRHPVVQSRSNMIALDYLENMIKEKDGKIDGIEKELGRLREENKSLSKKFEKYRHQKRR